MYSEHRLREEYTRSEKMELWVDGGVTSRPSEDRLTLTDAVERYAQKLDAEKLKEEARENDLRHLIIKELIKALTGKDIHTLKHLDFSEAGSGNKCPENVVSQEGEQRQGWGFSYDYHEMYAVEETTSCTAGGTVKTADGREISFAPELNMTRSFMEERNISIRAGDALLTDPLVINFEGNAADLTDWRFAFDLDADGDQEMMPFLSGGSGFLVFDRNGDGCVNDGSELFGPATGSGFSELAALDEDNNGWIDEGESVYDKLKVWTMDNTGNQSLVSLKESGVGAIGTFHLDTPFDIRNSENSLQGKIAGTGIYLSENGRAGTVQQIDLAV